MIQITKNADERPFFVENTFVCESERGDDR